MTLKPGLLLADRYELGQRIAVGGMGEVWEATDRRLGRQIAVKVLKAEFTSDPEFVDRFRAEARITASLNNPGIAAVYDYGETASHSGGRKDLAFLVMELVVGEPLSAVLARTPRLPVGRTLDMLEQSGRALQEAHARGLVHRDIKPGNILITPAGKVKITDFGIAKAASHVPLTRQGMVMGTAQYLAPEQAAGADAVTASDVYALAVVGYECLAGRRPFTGESQVVVAMAQIRNEPPPLPPDVPPAVAALIMQALVKDPAQRFSNGAAFADAVSVIRKGGSVPPGGRAPLHPSAPSAPPLGAGPLPPSAFQQGLSTSIAPRTRPPVPAVIPVRSRTGIAVTIAVLVLLLAAAVLIISYRGDGGPLDISAAAVLTAPFIVRTEPVRDLDLAMSAGSVRATDTTPDPAPPPYRHRGMQ